MRFAVISNIQSYGTLPTGAFGRKFLFLTNVLTSIGLTAAGDIIEQNLEIMSGDIQKFGKKRLFNMSISGMAEGIICHFWYIHLDRILPGRTFPIVMKKMLIDQTVCSPMCIASFFITMSILEGLDFKSTMNEVKAKAFKLYAAEWVIWPVAQIINFSILPTKYRVLYVNTISLAYNVYTSRIKYTLDKPPKKDD